MCAAADAAAGDDKAIRKAIDEVCRVRRERGGFARGVVGAAEWDDFGTALKPAHEPIVLARKPLSEATIAANVLKWGTGALNIDGCRVAD